MTNSEKHSSLDITSKLLRNFAFYKVIFFIAMGYMILFTDVFEMFVNNNLKKYGLGSAFFLYSIIRGIMVIRIATRHE
jgi:hypothetical protein